MKMLSKRSSFRVKNYLEDEKFSLESEVWRLAFCLCWNQYFKTDFAVKLLTATFWCIIWKLSEF